MNSIKRIGLVVISCIILLLACICPVSASGSPMFTRDDLLDIGFLEDDEGVLYFPSDGFDPFDFSFYLNNSKNYPDFNPNLIPWADSPNYVRDIIALGYDYFVNSFNSQSPSFDTVNATNTEYKVPFVGVRVAGNNVNVYVGYNLCLAVHYTTYRMVLCVPGNFYNGTNLSGWALYRATYDRQTLELTTPWYDARSSAEPWGDTGFLYSLTTSWLSETNAYDLYFYGANVDYKGRQVASVTYGLLNDDEYASAGVRVNYPDGFQSGQFFIYPEFYRNGYAAFFKPNIFGSVDTGAVDNYYGEQEQLYEEIPDFNPDDIFGEFDTSGWSFVFTLVQNFVVDYTPIFTLVSTMLTLGFIALILGR